ncbi:MAG TPA: selenocysteine-specific translation elongation factor [Gemmatales bacterium]|nr:selenocysteine-specific translation elongation factor [Gemmatales bacterium]
MPHDLILGTAGHIDHGKTSLVKALTGIDCDRLPEEKARGITIDIGFAHLELGDYRLGIVDVPGHERFIKNMLAGATGIDLALLVVSAKESIKPQTVEHLEILKLLGVKHGVIALTMADLVDETTREVVALEVRELVQKTFLADAPIIATSALTGMGIEELKSALAQAASKVAAPTQHPWFRLAIDRAFIVQGHGTVVTGSVTSGSLKVGDEVAWLPGSEIVRVRSLQNHDQPVQEIRRGMRAALNLAGVKHEDVERGQELSTPGYLVPSKVITVRLYNLPALDHPIKHRFPVRLHLGTIETLGTVSLLDSDQLAPGEWGLAQLFLEEPVLSVYGQPFVIRSPSATATLGGGQVLQPTPEKIRRRHVELLERLEKLWSSNDATERAMQCVWFQGQRGVTVADLVRGAGLYPEQAESVLKLAISSGQIKSVQSSTGKQMLLHADIIHEIHERVKGALAKLHAEFPLMSTHDRFRVQSQLAYVGDDALVQAAVDDMLRTKTLLGDSKRIALADHKPKLSVNQRKLKDKMIESFKAARYQPPEIASFAPQAAGNASALKDITEVCVAEGYLIPIAEGVYLHTDNELAMREMVRKLLQEGKGLMVADIRDILATTRKFAVPLCEYLDRIGITRREGDLRYLTQS